MCLCAVFKSLNSCKHQAQKEHLQLGKQLKTAQLTKSPKGTLHLGHLGDACSEISSKWCLTCALKDALVCILFSCIPILCSSSEAIHLRVRVRILEYFSAVSGFAILEICWSERTFPHPFLAKGHGILPPCTFHSSMPEWMNETT